MPTGDADITLDGAGASGQAQSSHIAISTIEDAIHAAVVAGSGLAEDHVIWTHQAGRRPDRPFINLGLTSMRQIGIGWVDKTRNPNPPPTNGDVVHRARAPQRYQLQLECMAGEMTGLNGAISILSQFVSTLAFTRAALNRAGVSVGTVGDVVPVGNARLDKLLEPRATLQVTLHVRSEATMLGPEIRRVVATSGNTGQTSTIDLDDPPADI